MEFNDLPKTWKACPLGDFIKLQCGYAFKSADYHDKGWPIVRISNLENETVNVIESPRIDFYRLDEFRAFILHTGDVLIALSGATTGKLGVVPHTCQNWLLNQRVARFIVQDSANVDQRFVYWAAKLIQKKILDTAYGGAQPNISPNDIEAMILPFPPLAEQRRIVTRIEELTRRIEEARKLRQEAAAEAERYIPAALSSIFEDEQKAGWIIQKVKRICAPPQYGYTEPARQEAVGPKLLRITDIQDGKVDWETVPYCRCNATEKYRLKSADILFARTGATTGKSFLVVDPPEAVFASYLIRLRVGPSILPEFLYWFFQSATYWAAVSSGIEEGNRPNMNGTKLANLDIPYPEDKSEQRRIVEYLNRLQSKSEELKRLQAETEAELATFTPALLAKAFRGEL